jgi:Aspartyl protease
MISPQVVNNWRHKNKQLFYEYPDEWVAFTPEKGIIDHDTDLHQLVNRLKAISLTLTDFVLKFVHPSELPYKIRIVPLRIFGIRKKEWSPDYTIILKTDIEQVIEEMLIDSGADISVISKKIGELLGLQTSKYEVVSQVGGVGGGTIDYLTRKITFVIDNHEVTAPVAWLQDDKYNELIVGREVIFDVFDIEFKQADETIVFKKRVTM